MSVIKEYNIDDTVWIYGISEKNNKLTKGKIVKIFNIDRVEFNEGQKFYVIAIPTEIEPLLEIRTWETISQDDKGPVGGLRENFVNVDANNKKISQSGYTYNHVSDIIDNDPSPDEIVAALESSASNLVHQAMNFNKKPEFKPKFKQQKKKTFTKNKL